MQLGDREHETRSHASPSGGLPFKMVEEIKKEYETLQKKYSLPDFDTLDHDFEIRYIENSHFLTREIRRKLYEKIDSFSSILKNVLQPDTSCFEEMQECRIFDDDEKQDIYLLLKDLIIFKKRSLMLGIHPDEEREAQFINDVFLKWQNIKERLQIIVNKMIQSWEKETDVKEDLEYFG